MKIGEASTEAYQGAATWATADRTAPDPDGELARPEIDPSFYNFQGIFARGGVGLILRARDRRLRRPVAIKLILRGNPAVQARFEREAWLTARLQHPGVVPIYEAGRWPNGESFYAMRLVEGQPLSAVIASCTSLDERLALLPKVVAVTEAVAYAHTERVIHRDLKPQNVVIGAFGEVVVIDWGLAKDLAQAEAGREGDSLPGSGVPSGSGGSGSGGQTVIGSVVGTPAYMPPEQARGEAVDERADVYSLGAMLYHVLTGAPPLTASSGAEVLHQVLTAGPPPIESRQPGVPRDLATLIGKAMEREPANRYASAGELSEELKRFVTGQLVQAHRYSRGVLFRRAIRRHPLAAAIGVFAIVLALFGGMALRRILNEKAATESRGRQLLLGQARALLQTDPTASVALLKRYPDRGGDTEAVRAIALDAESRGVARHVLSVHSRDVRDVAISPDGGEVASVGADGALYLWNLATGAHEKIHSSTTAMTNVLFDPKGHYLVASLGPLTGILVWDRAARTSRKIEVEDDVYTIGFSPDGALLAGGSIGGSVFLWSVAGGQTRVLEGHQDWVSQVVFSPDGKSLLSVSQDGTARLWTLADGTARTLKLDAQGYTGTFSRDGQTFAVGAQDGSVRVYSAADPALPPRVLRGDSAAADYVAFSPDGTTLAWGGMGRAVHVADLATGELQALHGHEDDVTGMSFLPDGTLLTASGDATVRRWDLASGLSAVLRGHTDQIQGMAVDEERLQIASCSADRSVRVWQLAPAPPSFAINPSRESDYRSPAGNGFLYFHQDGHELGILDVATGKVRLIETERPWARVAGNPAGTQLAYRDLQRQVAFIDLATEKERALPPEVALVGAAIEYSPDGQTLAFPGWPGLYLVDVASLEVRMLPYPSGELHGQDAIKVTRVQFSSDGGRVFAVGKEIVIWDVASGRATVIPPPPIEKGRFVAGSRDLHAIAASSVDGLWLFDGHKDWRLLMSTGRDVYPIAFSKDESRVAAADDQGRLRVWRTADLTLVDALVGHDGPLRRLEFSDDGAQLVSADVAGAVRLWDLATGQELRAIRAHNGRAIEWVGFRGKQIATAGRDGMARVWPALERRSGAGRPAPVRLDQLPPRHVRRRLALKRGATGRSDPFAVDQ